MMEKLKIRAGHFFAALPIYLLSIGLAMAGALDQPKADGLIGEQLNGYLGLVRQDVPADIKALVSSVNAKRKTRYQAIAQEQNVPLLEVEKVGGVKAIERTRRGNFIKDSSNSWRRK